MQWSQFKFELDMSVPLFTLINAILQAHSKEIKALIYIRDILKVAPPIYFHGNYNRYWKHYGTIG